MLKKCMDKINLKTVLYVKISLVTISTLHGTEFNMAYNFQILTYYLTNLYVSKTSANIEN